MGRLAAAPAGGKTRGRAARDVLASYALGKALGAAVACGLWREQPSKAAPQQASAPDAAAPRVPGPPAPVPLRWALACCGLPRRRPGGRRVPNRAWCHCFLVLGL
ncbi:hypothetical protein E2562_031110 [Oryza meyeriana var. granulata]|uniref:Uncharacterized protein n=1 Tax=Oryza meyeriana var. granulata TaxID=110450 RepID=A0A6G1CJN1_9ORYZ|nr:hypothetical protein E2562_031110 [Oryza meyeriana var. granulata]